MALSSAQKKTLASIKKKATALQKTINAKASSSKSSKSSSSGRYSTTDGRTFSDKAQATAHQRTLNSAGQGRTSSSIKRTPPREPVKDTPRSADFSSAGIYPMSDYSLLRFQGQGPTGYIDDQTIWLVDPSNKTLRPFSGRAALSNFFDGEVDPDQIRVVSAADLMPGGAYGPMNGAPGYQILSREYAINPDGSALRLEYSNAQLATRYGKPVNEELEQTMFSALKGVFKMLESAGVDPNTIKRIQRDDAQMAFYVSAMAYGDYSIGDIYSDVKKRELGIKNVSPISPTADKSSYAATKEYQNAASDTRIMPPVEFAGMNSAELDLPVYQLPDEAFKTLIPILDYDSQEFKDAMAAVETSYYDLLEQQLNATTEQEKAMADYEYQDWKKQVERNFGIALSDNAMEAWNQIQQLYNQGSQSGTLNSGIQNESIDSYLRRVREQDQRVRDEKLTNEDRKAMSYYLSAASSQEIKDLIERDPEKAKAWGLVPSDEIKNALSLTELKKKYPNAKEEDLAQYVSILLDENGNYRSQLYQNQMGGLGDLNPNSASLGTLTGISTAREQFQRSEALRKSLLEEEEAYKEFTRPDVAFLRNSDPKSFESVAGLRQSSGKMDNFSSIIRQAGSGITTSGTPTTPTTTTAGTKPTPSHLSAMKAQLEAAQKQLDSIKSRQTSPVKVSNTAVSTKPSTKPTITEAQRSSMLGQLQEASRKLSQIKSNTSRVNSTNNTVGTSSKKGLSSW